MSDPKIDAPMLTRRRANGVVPHALSEASLVNRFSAVVAWPWSRAVHRAVQVVVVVLATRPQRGAPPPRSRLFSRNPPARAGGEIRDNCCGALSRTPDIERIVRLGVIPPRQIRHGADRCTSGVGSHATAPAPLASSR
jgi:hypothetical protein